MRLLFLIGRLPLWCLYRLSDILFFLVYYVIRYRRAVVYDNLRKGFPQWTDQACRRVSRSFYRHFMMIVVEILKSATISPAELRRRVTLLRAEEVKRFLIDKKQPVIFLTSHQGNWEWSLLAASLESPYPIYAVYKKLKQQRVDQFMKNLRSRFGATLIPDRQLLRLLADKRKNSEDPYILAMVSDQSPPNDKERYWTQCLGRDTSFSKSIGKVAVMMQAPVFFVGMRRLSQGRYAVTYTLISEPPYEKDDAERILDLYAQAFEKELREAPEQWLWSNRKWKHQRLQS